LTEHTYVDLGPIGRHVGWTRAASTRKDRAYYRGTPADLDRMSNGSSATDIRFAFGRNWRRFLDHVDDTRIRDAERSLTDMLDLSTLAGRSFLDIGSGSGLFSLAAARLGAAKVHSFDFDDESVACTAEVRRRFAPDACWQVERGSVLDDEYLARLGRWDVVYSWGVLHHTGDLWGALERAAQLVSPGGLLFVALYNDQGWRSRLWMVEKRAYVRHPWLRPVLVAGGLAGVVAGTAAKDLFRGVAPWRRYGRRPVRGMALLPDVVDWMGGYPFQVAAPHEVQAFLQERCFSLVRLVGVGGSSGCNEFVFRAATEESATGAKV